MTTSDRRWTPEQEAVIAKLLLHQGTFSCQRETHKCPTCERFSSCVQIPTWIVLDVETEDDGSDWVRVNGYCNEHVPRTGDAILRIADLEAPNDQYREP